MKRILFYGLAGAAVVLTAGLIFIAGCGGGGGLINVPETGPGPSVNAQFIALMSDAQRSATYVGADKCLPCHSGDTHNKIYDNWTLTKHNQMKVGCEQCHGPASVHVAAQQAARSGVVPAKIASLNTRAPKTRSLSDEILTYPNIVEPVVCGQCHGPTYEQYLQSPHASIVQSPAKGGSSTCMRCHSATVRTQFIESQLTYKGYHEQTALDIDTNIVNTFKDSNKVKTLVAATQHTATCVTCHAPHQRTAYLASSGDQRQLRRQTETNDLKNKDETTVAFWSFGVEPESPIVNVKFYSTFNHMCASCHNGRGANGSDAILQVANSSRPPNIPNSPQFNMLQGIGGAYGTGPGPIIQHGSHTDVPNQCVHCHMPNRRHTFTVSYDTSCQPCHTTADASGRAGATKQEILNGLFALRARMENWAKAPANFGNQDFWDYPALLTEEGVSPLPDQTKVPIQVRRARHNYYFIIRDKSLGIHNLVYSRYLLTQANSELDAIGVSRPASRAQMPPAQILQMIQRDLLRAQSAEVHSGERL